MDYLGFGAQVGWGRYVSGRIVNSEGSAVGPGVRLPSRLGIQPGRCRLLSSHAAAGMELGPVRAKGLMPRKFETCPRWGANTFRIDSIGRLNAENCELICFQVRILTGRRGPERLE